MLAGYTWPNVKCPSCEQINELPIDDIKISEWERFLELRFIKITCSNCKKTIYCKRESEYVSCDTCNNIMSIIKEVPLRPTVYQHQFAQSVLIPDDNNNKNIQSKTFLSENKKSNINDTFKPLFQTVRDNHINLLYKQNNENKNKKK